MDTGSIMNYKVVYFTRTGNSKRVAGKIADKLSCKAIAITDNMNWNGFLGFIKAGYYAMLGKDVKININGNVDDAKELIVVTPLWADRTTPAIRTFLKKMPLEKIHLVIISKSSRIKDRSGFKSVSEVIEKENNEDTVIESLVHALRGKPGL